MKILDIEADSLEPTKIWCVCTIDVDTGEEYVWTYFDQGLPKLDARDVFVGHNLLGYDIPALRKILNVHVVARNCIDTLVCSKLFSFGRSGGHSLSALAEALGGKKTDFDEWTACQDPDLERDRMQRCVRYCLNDCRETLRVYRHFEKFIKAPQWSKSLRVEHEAAIICQELHENGFKFDVESARTLHNDLAKDVRYLTEELQKAFPPRAYAVSEVTPRLTQHGTISKSNLRFVTDGDYTKFTPGAPFTRIEWEDFNPGSPLQVVQRLNEAGWTPFEKTTGHKDAEKELRELKRIPAKRRDVNRITELEEKLKHYEIYGYKISEENLATLPDDANAGCRVLVKHRMLSKRLQTLDEWLENYNPRTQRIHGNYNHIGTWTHRKSHSNPNQGNVPSVDSKYHSRELKEIAKATGKSMRSLFNVPKGKRLVGVDADGIQLRILAHYMNDKDFTQAIISGVKNDERPDLSTDVHTLNALKLGLGYAGRPRAKTFIYAWLLGAGISKVSKILGLSFGEASDSVEAFIDGYPGLRRLKDEVIPEDARRGYYTGFDGRLIKCDEYHMLAGYLQTGESVIMKHAAVKWHKDLRTHGIGFKIVNDVHDEWQTEIDDDDEVSKEVIRIQSDSIRYAGEQFGLNCPLAGSGKFGYNWYETH